MDNEIDNKIGYLCKNKRKKGKGKVNEYLIVGI